jgi:prepilin-type N-terminal cleavage/methylation domain-containing protein
MELGSGKRGFTLVEILITVSITIILAAAAFPVYGSLQVSAQLNENSSQIIQALRTAKQRSLAGYNNSEHGVKFVANSYVLFQGSSYAVRQSTYDRSVTLDSPLGLFWSFGGGVDEINFSKGVGVPNTTGTITLVHDVSGTRTISINSLGMVEEN